MTYGQYRSWAGIMRSGLFKGNALRGSSKRTAFREHGMVFLSSPVVSYAWLFKLIKPKTISTRFPMVGLFTKWAWDQAIMFPLLEMSGASGDVHQRSASYI